MRPIFKVLGLGLLVSCISAQLALFSYAEEMQRQVVRVAFPVQEAISEYRSDGSPAGYNYVYLEKLSEFTGWDIEYVRYEDEDPNKALIAAIGDLQDGKIDLIGPMLKNTDAEKEQFEYSQQSYGTVYITLCSLVTGGLREENLHSHDQIKLGLLSNANITNSKIQRYLAQEDVNYETSYYDSDDKLLEALKNGEVDLISGVSLSPVSGTRIVQYIDPRPFYFAAQKGNTELVNQLDAAIAKLNEVQPDFQNEIFDDIFGNVNIEFVLTDSQKELLKSIGKLQVLCVDNDGPYVFNNNGKPTGMLVSIIDSFAAKTGLEIEYTFTDTRSEAEKQLAKSDYDMIIGTPFSSRYCRAIGFMTSERVMKSNFLMAYRPYETKRDTAALVVGNEDKINTSSFKSVKLYDNTSKCLEAVKSGEADVAIGDRSILEYYTHDGQGSLNVTLLTGETQDICIALSDKSDVQFIGLFNNYINSLTEVEKTNFLDDGSVHTETMSFSDFIQKYPVYAVIMVSILSVGLSMVLFGSYYFYRMRKKNEELRLANEVKSDFLTRMSHDIRTPMNGIIGLLDISDRFVDDPELTRKYHRKIHMASEYLLSLINDVLNMSKLESGKVQLTEESVYLRELIANCRDILAARAEELGVTLDSSGIEDFNPPRVLASPLHLRQILINIIGNAIKYNKPDGSVNISASVIEQTAQTITCEFIIADTGIGMSEDFQKHAFEAFSQENRETHGELKGTGLGLSIVKKLVDTMGGSIRIESKLGVGSRFIWTQTFDIDKAYIEPAQETFKPEIIDLHGKRVLAAEDNALNAEILQFMLEDEGLEVILTANGLEAVNEFAKSSQGYFDFILMDIMMPEMNGYEAARAIRRLKREDARRIPIIALTANAYAEDKQKALEAGMNDHVAKPVDLSQLLRALAQCCKSGKC